MATFNYNAEAKDYTISGDSNLSQYGQTGKYGNVEGTSTAGNPTVVNPQGPTKLSESELFGNAFTWEPKYQHRFIMSMTDGIPSHLIKASAKPTLENGEISLDHINIKRKLKGKSVWNSISITIYDAIVPSAAQAVMQWVRQHHESATGRDGYSGQYKKDIKLKQLSGLGEVIEEWNLYGCYLQSINFGSLDWSAEDVVTIEATLNYDYAFLSF
jgi:hypothetical protein